MPPTETGSTQAAIIGTVSSTCSNAEDDLSAYSSSYG